MRSALGEPDQVYIYFDRFGDVFPIAFSRLHWRLWSLSRRPNQSCFCACARLGVGVHHWSW